MKTSHVLLVAGAGLLVVGWVSGLIPSLLSGLLSGTATGLQRAQGGAVVYPPVRLPPGGLWPGGPAPTIDGRLDAFKFGYLDNGRNK